MEQTLPRKIAQQRWAVNERRQELTSLSRLRADLSRQLAALDRAATEGTAARRTHLQQSIQQLEGQIEEARAQMEGAQRILRRLETSVEPEQPRRRRRRAS